jgi:hypothetical protein
VGLSFSLDLLPPVWDLPEAFTIPFAHAKQTRDYRREGWKAQVGAEPGSR